MSSEDSTGPRTAGEILRGALAWQREQRAPDGTPGPQSPVAHAARVDHVEDLLEAIVAGALGVGSVSREVGFSALGGDSLAAVRVLANVWRAWGVRLPLSALAPDVSVRALSETLRRARRAAGRDGELAPRRRAAPRPEPLLPGQAAIWFAQASGGPAALYNIPYALRVRGPLRHDALERALGRLVDRHAALRLRFLARDGQLLQEPCAECVRVPLARADLGELGPAAREARARALAVAHVCRPFDLAAPPLLRALCVSLARDHHVLVLSIHHIVCDAWSLKLMTAQLSRDLGELDFRRERDAQAAAAGEQLGFLDFVAWQHELLGGERARRLAAGWRGALGDLSEVPPLRTDHPRAAAREWVGAIEPLELSCAFVDELRRFSGEQGVTLYMTLLSAFALVLSAWNGSESVIVGSPAANREHRCFQETVGCFTNMLALRVDCGAQSSTRELLRGVRATALAAYDRQALPFAELVRLLAPPRHAALSPIFQAALVLNELSTPPWEGVGVSQLHLHTGTAKLDLTCYLEERDGALSGYLEYAGSSSSPRRSRSWAAT